MPLPMMVPTTIALAWLTPRSRESEGGRLMLSAGCKRFFTLGPVRAVLEDWAKEPRNKGLRRRYRNRSHRYAAHFNAVASRLVSLVVTHSCSTTKWHFRSRHS